MTTLSSVVSVRILWQPVLGALTYYSPSYVS